MITHRFAVVLITLLCCSCRSGPEKTASPSEVSKKPKASTVAIRAIDSRWIEYGTYLNELVEVIEAEWKARVDEQAVQAKPGDHVDVTFLLNSKGEVRMRVVTVQPVGMARIFIRQCTEAITKGAPYRRWSGDMIAHLGMEQELTFSFYYY